ncbi:MULTISPECIES: transporter suffix domain-containing protein [Acinetobacter]|uniref:transporter suffix domain-containing protein n=1 Tax=Acinetobacter TaxID=469 RepID=UPI0012506554|nr:MULTISPECIES: transporter suffix domain-containing protein [Acinetobacter]URM39725.1 transporter suffix domain-containing protein [Acinetobacter sp. AS23]
MPKPKLNLKKKIGLVLLGFVALYWISFPILPILDIPYKAAVITGLMIVGEILFLIAIALLGKEYWGKIKQWFSKIFRKMKLKEN